MIGRTLLDRYLITSELGRGGLGIVFQADDQLLKRPVAIKMLTQSGLDDTEGRHRLIHEARAAANLDHPNIVTVYDVVEADGATYLVMQLIDGHTLKERRPDSLEEIISSAQQIAVALDYAHTRGVVHRDIKPANVMISSDRSVKLMDFGLARSVSSQLTFEGGIAGTMDYISPEQIQGEAVDGRTDIYSFGVLLYELTTGRLPFVADTPVSLLSQHLHAPVVPPIAKNASIPTNLSELIVRMMSKSAGERPETANQVREQLDIIHSSISDPAVVSAEPKIGSLDRIVRGRLIGRQRELSEAQSLWQESVGGQGRTLLITGEPGIGKSRLLQELTTQVEASGSLALTGNCYAEDQIPYGSISQILDELFKSISGTDSAPPEYIIADLIEIVPSLRKRYPQIAPSQPLDPKSQQGRLIASITDLFNTLNQRWPLLIIIDDAHWADSGSSQIFLNLARRLRSQRVMLIATYREVEIEDVSPFLGVVNDLNRERLVSRIKLTRLDKQASEHLLETLFEEAITPEFLEGIYLETEGNPFFIEEVCKSLVESGDLYFEDGIWHRPSLEEMKIPPSIKSAIQSRLRKLPLAVQDTLRLAAIFGRVVEYNLLLIASGLDEDTLIGHLELASQAQILEEASENGQIFFNFGHGLIPTTLVDEMLALRRRRHHGRVARTIEEQAPENYEVLAYHFEQAHNDQKALEYHIQSAKRAVLVGANQEAAHYFLSALEYDPPPDVKSELFDNLGSVYARQGRFELAIAAWEEAVALYSASNQEDSVARLYGETINALWGAGQKQKALEYGLEKALIVQRYREGPGRALFLHELARICAFNNLASEAEEYGSRALMMARKTGPIQAHIDSLTTLAMIGGQFNPDQVVMLDQAVELAKEHGLPSQESRALNNRAVARYLNFADFVGAFDDYSRAVDLTHRIGEFFNEQYFLGGVVLMSIFLGRYKLSHNLLARLGRMFAETSDPGPLFFRYHGIKALISFELGEYDSSLQQSQAVFREADAKNNSTYKVWTNILIARILLFREEPIQAIRRLEDVVVESRGVENYYEHELNSYLVIAHTLAGDLLKASEVVSISEKRLRESGWPLYDRALFIRAKAHFSAANKQWDDSWNLFEEAVEQFDKMKRPWLVAKTRQEWGETHLLRAELEDKIRAHHLISEAAQNFYALDIPVRADACRQILETLK